MIKEQAESFIRDALGCQCPAELFKEIRDEVELTGGPLFGAFFQADVSLVPTMDRALSVGGRLLVVVTRSTDKEALQRLLAAGKVVRDNLGFNRFRLAMVVPIDSHVVEETMPAHLDERVHLHRIEFNPAVLTPEVSDQL